MNTSEVTLFSTKIQDVKKAKKEWSAKLLKGPRVIGFRAFGVASSAAPNQNVVGVAVGEQITADKPTGVLAVKFFVRVKYPQHELLRKDALPKSIDGLPVD